MFVVATRNFPPDLGGIQNLMEGLSNSLLNHGPVKVFADEFKESDIYDKKSKLDINRIGGLRIFRKYRKANLIKEYFNDNIVRAIFFDHWKSIENISSDVLKKTTSFCLIHSKEINHSENTLINRRMCKALSKANFVIANSDFTKNLAEKNGVERKKIKIINPGTNYPIDIDQKYIDQAKTLFENSFPKIITVARLDKRKSHQNILMTIKNIKPKFPQIKYISIGDGDEKKNLENLRKELGLANNVDLIYNIDEQLKAALIKESELFLMPSVKYKKSVEGFGISFIEAASYGVGSIGGEIGGASDAIKNNETGFLCNGNDLSSIYDCIVKFFDNDNYKNLGSNAENFSKNFKWEKIIKKYLRLI